MGSVYVSKNGFKGAVPKWLRERSAKPLFSGSNPLGASYIYNRKTNCFFRIYAYDILPR
jgi:hypothetical protein